MYNLIVQTEEDFQQLTGIEKEVAVIIVSHKETKQLIKGLNRIQIHNKREDRHIKGKEVQLAGRKGLHFIGQNNNG